MSLSNLRVAVVHDWLTGMRGGEKVLEELLAIMPGADVFTLVYIPERISPAIRAHRVIPSYVDGLPMAHRRHQIYLPLLPAAVGDFDLSGYDLVVSTSHCVAKGAVVRPHTLHVCYCHTPMRYIWDFKETYFGHVRFLPLRIILSIVLEALRVWDVVTARRVDAWIANSQNVRSRLRKYFAADAAVIPPPVDTDAFVPAAQPALDAFVCLSAMVPYKRLDLAVKAAGLLGARLCVIGDGVESDALRRVAGPTVEFLGTVDATAMRDALAGAIALVFPGEEDFGITPLEANACGRPVVAYRAGGALESMVEGQTAVFFDAQTPEALASAMDEARKRAWDPAAIRANALRYSRQVFRERMAAFLDRAWTEFAAHRPAPPGARAGAAEADAGASGRAGDTTDATAAAAVDHPAASGATAATQAPASGRGQGQA